MLHSESQLAEKQCNMLLLLPFCILLQSGQQVLRKLLPVADAVTVAQDPFCRLSMPAWVNCFSSGLIVLLPQRLLLLLLLLCSPRCWLR